MGKTKQPKEKKVRQYRSNQGRSPQQIENSYKAIEWSFFGLIITTVIYSLGKALGIW